MKYTKRNKINKYPLLLHNKSSSQLKEAYSHLNKLSSRVSSISLTRTNSFIGRKHLVISFVFNTST